MRPRAFIISLTIAVFAVHLAISFPLPLLGAPIAGTQDLSSRSLTINGAFGGWQQASKRQNGNGNNNTNTGGTQQDGNSVGNGGSISSGGGSNASGSDSSSGGGLSTSNKIGIGVGVGGGCIAIFGIATQIYYARKGKGLFAKFFEVQQSKAPNMAQSNMVREV